jgi:hypothetical protein
MADKTVINTDNMIATYFTKIDFVLIIKTTANI